MNKAEKNIIPSIETQKIWDLLEAVKDPEVPVLSVIDIGIIRDVVVTDASLGTEKVVIYITPTYSGCPAMDVIAIQIKIELLQQGYKQVEVKQILSPAWTTDWMTEAGKKKLKAFGIAPPQYKVAEENSNKLFTEEQSIQCPHCNSLHTTRISEFGSTTCKALYRCEDCREPFDYFKCH